MTITVGKAGGGSAYVIPALPTPLKDDGLPQHTTAYSIPHKGAAVDNIKLNATSSVNFIGSLGAATVWTVAATDINASATGFIGRGGTTWYDSVNGVLYVVAINTATTPDTYYLAHINLENGTVTNIGSGAQLSTDMSGQQDITLTIWRDAIDSGNFTIKNATRTLILNETTGAEVSNLLGGYGTGGGCYTSLDGTIILNSYQSSEGAVGYLVILSRNDNGIKIPLPPGYMSGGDASIYATAWGDKVKIFTTTSSEAFFSTFNRVEFDAYLSTMCDIGGLA